jgi:hypothetical protein
VRQIGVDVGRKGLKDVEIISLLHKLKRATFFTRDAGFYQPTLCQKRYCLVYLNVEEDEVAEFVRRFLRHKAFQTRAERMGTVCRVSISGIAYWRLRAKQESQIAWKRQPDRP